MSDNYSSHTKGEKMDYTIHLEYETTTQLQTRSIITLNDPHQAQNTANYLNIALSDAGLDDMMYAHVVELEYAAGTKD